MISRSCKAQRSLPWFVLSLLVIGLIIWKGIFTDVSKGRHKGQALAERLSKPLV